MPNITIDGKQVEFKSGQTVIQAAMNAGIDIPHFCYHPKLSISGNCRVCLVEIEKMPKLAIACSTLATEGMVVHTNSSKTLDARNAVMEFILINHPLDCPICDEAGECKLQDYAFAHSRGESRFEEIKNRKEKRVQLGPRIKFDAERCISCSRCIRFSDEIAKANQLTFTNRGDKVTITTFPGESFDNPYTLNTVDICPVGALTNNDFRFKSRVWEMSSTNSVCIGCSRGCNIEIWVRNNEILRLTPRQNEEVNSFWMCDNGRLNTFKFVNDESRIDGCYLRKDGQLVKSDWAETLEVTSKSLKEFKSNEIAFVASPFATLEDNFVLERFAKQINSNNIFSAKHILTGDQDDILIREDKTPNSFGLSILGIKNDISKLYDLIDNKNVKALFIMEEDLVGLNSEWEKVLTKLELIIVLATNKNGTTQFADIIFPAATYAEKHGTFVNFQGRVQRIRPAIATEELDRSLDGMNKSRWDKFGTKFDRWMQGKKYDAKPSWKIIALLDSYFNNKLKFKMAEEVFNEISKSNEALKNLDYDVIGDLGVTINSEVFQKV
ncbi:MAG: molybdopterin-dependent oxidoreductase [Melioribacteraceae bacterium]|nr:molybdopterin-dependent oxidoreductase [Melioribacteraceae bacterium]